MKGFVYSIPAIKDGRLTQWSHMLGVTRDARDAGLGLKLKLAQRERALRGHRPGRVDLRSAAGAQRAPQLHPAWRVVKEYEENIYGASSSPLHSGSPTDRFVAEWKLSAPHVERRSAAGGLGGCATGR